MPGYITGHFLYSDIRCYFALYGFLCCGSMFTPITAKMRYTAKYELIRVYVYSDTGSAGLPCYCATVLPCYRAAGAGSLGCRGWVAVAGTSDRS